MTLCRYHDVRKPETITRGSRRWNIKAQADRSLSVRIAMKWHSSDVTP